MLSLTSKLHIPAHPLKLLVITLQACLIFLCSHLELLGWARESCLNPRSAVAVQDSCWRTVEMPKGKESGLAAGVGADSEPPSCLSWKLVSLSLPSWWILMNFTASNEAKAGQLFEGTNTSALDWKERNRRRQGSGCDEPRQPSPSFVKLWFTDTLPFTLWLPFSTSYVHKSLVLIR